MSGAASYAPRHRTEWLNKIGEAGVRRRAEFLPTARCSARVAPSGAEGSVGRESQTERDQIAAPGSFDRRHPSRAAHRADPNASSFPHQAATVDIQRTGDQYARQCATPLRGRTTATFEEAPARSPSVFRFSAASGIAMAPDVAETTRIDRPPRGRGKGPVQLSRLFHGQA